MAVGENRPVTDLPLTELQPAVRPEHVERVLRGGEDDPVLPFTDPERPADSARQVQHTEMPLVEPGGRHRPVQRLERLRIVVGVRSESEDGLGVDGHARLGPRARMLGKQLVVVLDPPVVDTDDGAVPDRMVVRSRGRVALGEVAHVHEQLVRSVRHRYALEQLRRRGLLLDDDERRAGARRLGIRVSDCVGSSLGDRGQQCLRGQCSIEARVGGEGISGDSAHDLIVRARTDKRP